MTTELNTIAQAVAELQQRSAGRLPAEVADTFSAEVASLEVTDVSETAALAGTSMPDGALLDAFGQPTTLAQVRAGGPALVVFYRGAWCPYCNLTLRTYQQALASELEERGIALIAISPQKPEGSLTMQETHALTYAVVSDPGNHIARQLGILTEPSEKVRNVQASLGLDISATNADGTHGIPMPTVVIVDSGGTIRWIDVHPDYTTRSEPGEILHALATTLSDDDGQIP